MNAETSQEAPDELCPSCGNWVFQLINATGWCRECTARLYPDKIICEECGRIFTDTGKSQKFCSSCKDRLWRQKHKARIDFYLSLGYSKAKTYRIIKDEIRPRCLICNNPIKGGTAGKDYFCSKTNKCRKAKQRMQNMIDRYGFTKGEALERIVNEHTDQT